MNFVMTEIIQLYLYLLFKIYNVYFRSLFGNGDYHGCVNACTEALKLNPGVPSFYSNRAAANLALNNLHHTISDCSKVSNQCMVYIISVSIMVNDPVTL